MHRPHVSAVGLAVLLPVLAMLLGAASPAVTGQGGRARGVTDPIVKAEKRVAKAVTRGLAGRRLPKRTVPALGKELKRDRPDLGACEYGQTNANIGGVLCRRGDRSANRSIVVLGDSHGKHWVPAIEGYALEHGWSAYYLVKQKCTAARVRNADPEIDPTKHKPRIWKACQQFRDWTISAIADLQPDVVIVSTSVPSQGLLTPRGYSTDPHRNVRFFRQGFTDLFDRIAAVSRARIILLRDVPARTPGTHAGACWRPGSHTQRDCLARENSQTDRIRLVDASVRAARRAGVQVSDPTPFFCQDGYCPVVLSGGVLPYRNASHITTVYAAQLAEPLGRLMGLD